MPGGADSSYASAAAVLSSGSPREVGQPGPLEQPSGSFLLGPEVLGGGARCIPACSIFW